MKRRLSQQFLAYATGLIMIASSAAKADIIEDADLVLKGAQTILDGGTVSTAAQPIGAVDGNLRTRYEPALWELYKAVKGVNFVNGVETPGRTGTQRRMSLRNAALALKELTYVQSLHNVNAQTRLEVSMDKVLNITMQQDNITGARGVISLAGAYNPIYNFLPATIGSINTQQRAEAMRKFIKKLPVEHRRVIYPIFLIKKKPVATDTGGGTWKPEGVTAFKGVAREANTGVKYSALEILLVHDSQNLIAEGVIGIPSNRVTGSGIDGVDTWGYTLTHECGHAVDYKIGLLVKKDGTILDPAMKLNIPGLLPGITYASDTFASLNPGPGERVAEAYSRYFMNRSKICEEYPDESYYHETGETDEVKRQKEEIRAEHRTTAAYKTCNTKIINYLTQTKAERNTNAVDAEGNPLPLIFK